MRTLQAGGVVLFWLLLLWLLASIPVALIVGPWLKRRRKGK